MSTLNEKKMTGSEKKKREKIVKGMKKSLPYMRKKYGKRAKNVMYATATKQAMKENVSFDGLVEKLLGENYQFKREA